jgi:hypothetical protein
MATVATMLATFLLVLASQHHWLAAAIMRTIKSMVTHLFLPLQYLQTALEEIGICPEKH